MKNNEVIWDFFHDKKPQKLNFCKAFYHNFGQTEPEKPKPKVLLLKLDQIELNICRHYVFSEPLFVNEWKVLQTSQCSEVLEFQTSECLVWIKNSWQGIELPLGLKIILNFHLSEIDFRTV